MKQQTRVLNDEQILQLFNLQPQQVETIAIESKKDALYVSLTLNVEEHECPVCGNKTRSIKGYTKKKILHAAITYKACYIVYRARRYICGNCKKTFNEHNPFSYKNMKVSALTVSNVLEDLKSPTETFTTVAKRYGLSPTTVTSVFDSHVSIARRKLPKFITIDEVYAFHSERSDYVCVLVDFLSRQTIDILPTRRKTDLQLYFSQIPLEERKQVQIVSCDMWETYRIVVKHMFPYADCALDKFHLYQEFHRRMNKIRIEVMKAIQPPKEWKNSPEVEKREAYYQRDKKYYLLKKWNWLLTKNDETKYKVDGKEYELSDPNMPKKFNTKLQQYCNFNDLLTMILDCDSRLEEAYNLKYFLNEFYKKATIITASVDLEALISLMYDSDIDEFIQFGHTLRRWKHEIIISLNLVQEVIQKEDSKTGEITEIIRWRRVNNGIAENRNKIIKQIKHNSNGFHNWERFRNRGSVK